MSSFLFFSLLAPLHLFYYFFLCGCLCIFLSFFICGCPRINCFESAPPRWHLLAWLPGAKRRRTRETRDTRHTSLTFIHHMCPNPQKSSETETGSPEVQHVSHDATLLEKILHKVLTFESLKKNLNGKKIQKDQWHYGEVPSKRHRASRQWQTTSD